MDKVSQPIPKNANEFIEQQLDERAAAVAEAFSSDLLCLSGPLAFGVDDLIRTTIEDIRRNSNRRSLVVLITTEGGYAEVVQRIVETLRHHYRKISFVVPNSAFSAGTILAMSGDAIFMDYYSRLGPIDPQVETAKGVSIPALGYLVQWERLVKKAAEGKLTMAEIQLMVHGFDQAELYKYEQARKLSITLLRRWLVRYKFRKWKRTEDRRLKVTLKMKRKRAEDIATVLNNTDKWHTHGHGISMEVLRRDLNLKIDDFGEDPSLNDPIKNYDALLSDYMVKVGCRGAIHTVGRFLPYLTTTRR